MATKQLSGNIFETLSNNGSSSEEELQLVRPKDKSEKRIRPKKNKPTDEPVKTEIAHQNQTIVEQKEVLDRSKHVKDEKKDKKVSAEPHPLDKHSGTGRGKELRKGGAGKNNWGTMEDDLKQDPTELKQAQEQETVVLIEEVDNSLTLSELLAQKQKRVVKAALVENVKKEVDLTAFKKEKCELIQKKEEIDDRYQGKSKTTKIKENYQIKNTSELSDLIGVRTGLKTYSEKPRVEGEFEKKERKPREEKKHEEKVEKKEEDVQQKNYEKKEFKKVEKEGYQKPEERKSGVPSKQSSYKSKPSQNTGSKVNVNIEDNQSFPGL